MSVGSELQLGGTGVGAVTLDIDQTPSLENDAAK